MRAVEQEFYEAQFAHREQVPVPFLVRALERYVVSRNDIVLSLLSGGGTLVDVGCGDGTLVLKAAPMFREAHGVDISETAIEQAHVRARIQGVANTQFTVVNVNSEWLPFSDGTVDAVTCVAVLPWLFDPYAVMQEFHRVLRLGGELVVETNNLAYLPRRLALLMGKLPRTSLQVGWDGGTLHYFTMGALCKLFEESGFRVVARTGSGAFARWRNWWPSLLTGDLIIKGIKR